MSPDALRRAYAAGIRVDRYPAEKDLTDLQIAMDTAAASGARRIVVVGGVGGRLDHLLAQAALLTSPSYAGVQVTAHLGTATLTVIREEATLLGSPGAIVTLLPCGGPAREVRTLGLRYPLDAEDLASGTSRGVSNEFLGETATVRLAGGVLLAVIPGPEYRTPSIREETT